MKKGFVVLLIAVAVLTTACSARADEYRALWVNAWASGFESPSATTAMVNYAKSCNVNVVIPEIRLRADAYYASSIEPPGTGITPDPGYDSLGDIVSKAHALDMEVHPWIVTYRVWTTESGPPHTTPEHIWYMHPDWFMYNDTGGIFAGGISNLDPGHPTVEAYLIYVFMDIVQRYDIDGFALDYIRYPGVAWGYNPIAVGRFNSEYGRTGNPGNSDALWLEWRRDQISNLVKRLYLEIKAVKPWVKLGAAVWSTATVGKNSYLQDWDKWMQNHWIDYVSPMMYTSNNSTFHNWLLDAVGRQYGHHIYPLMDASNNITGNVLPQIDDVRSVGFPGVGLYCYSSIPNRTALKDALIGGPFPTFVNPTDMPWLSAPTKGYLKGFVRDSDENAIYPATVTILGEGLSTKDTGRGFYGFTEVTPGTYTVRAEALGYDTAEAPVTITAGQVADLDFVLQLETTPPVISNVRAENIQATNVQIKWDTDEPATSQVDYGLTAAYGTTTAEDMALVTSHTVQLIGLSPVTTYHFRVRSYDAARNMAESADYEFTTANVDNPVEIIIDNQDPECTTYGTWWTGSDATDKYGPDYYWSTTYAPDRNAAFRPDIVTAGPYDVYVWYCQGPNRTTQARWRTVYYGGYVEVRVNEQENGGQWNKIAEAAPFVAGTTGVVWTFSNTGDSEYMVIIADAVKFVYVGDTEPPTAPTNLTATAISPTQISLSWTASTDDKGVAGYKIYRNDSEVGTSTSNSYVDSGLAANTQYSYYVRAYDAMNNVSDPSNTVVRYTLSAAPGSGSVTCDKPTETWQGDPAFTFTAAGGFGSGTIEYYRYAWDQNSSYSWSGFEPQWTSGDLVQTATGSGSWYLHVKGYNAEDLDNGNYTYGPFKYDSSGPVMGSVIDDGMYTDAAGQLHATWSGSDPESGIAEYQYAVGTAPENIGSVVGWTSVGTDTSVTTSGLTLTSGTTYYFGVKARNGADSWSDPSVSDGITAADIVGTIAEAKSQPDGEAVMLTSKIVTANFGDHFYICEADRSSGIRVNGASPNEGDTADVSGVLQTISGERVITSPSVSSAAGGTLPDPPLMTNQALGGSNLNPYTPGVTGGFGVNNIGLLVTAVGRVTHSEAAFCYIDDGSSLNDGSGYLGVKVDTSTLSSSPTENAYARVTGISATELSGSDIVRLLKPRRDADVVTYP